MNGSPNQPPPDSALGYTLNPRAMNYHIPYLCESQRLAPVPTNILKRGRNHPIPQPTLYELKNFNLLTPSNPLQPPRPSCSQIMDRGDTVPHLLSLHPTIRCTPNSGYHPRRINAR